MTLMPSQLIASTYEGVVRGQATRIRDWAGELWADKDRLRRVLMIGGISLVAAVALVVYLTGGRYVSTDDAYVQAAKLMVTTDISGLVQDVDVHQGEHVQKGQVLFRIDPRPFQIALDNAKATLAQSVQDVLSTEADYRSTVAQANAQVAQVNLAQINYKRYAELASSHAIATAQLDQARGTYLSAVATLVSLQQNEQTQLAKLNGNPNLPPEQAPEYQKAKSAVDEAQRQLDHTIVRAPFEGDVSEVDSLQPGTLVVSALSSFSTTSAVGLVSTSNVWVAADMKETDLTHVHTGDPVDVDIDTYPGRSWRGTIDAVSRASDSAFSVLPSENSSANWVKVVQRIPVRIKLDINPGDPALRDGMSTIVTIDTHHRRWYRMLLGD